MNLLNKEESILNLNIIRAVEEMGFEQLTPIQEKAIPLVMEGKDIIGQAQTGTGKTAAFGIPLIQMVDPEDPNVQGIVLCPTRELAIQAADEMRKFARYMQGVKVLPIYGGQDISKQIRSLRDKVSIIVGTPGRVMDHMRRHTLKLGNLKMMVLDEADEMLNMGFREDIETILKEIPSEHQTALFSATMPQVILDITKTYLRPDAELVKVVHKELTIPLIKQYYYEVNANNKDDVVTRLLDYYNPKRSLIFCNTKHMVDTLADNLKGRGYFAEGLHGDLSQNQRDKVMNGFRNGTVEILIATDVAARGIDVDDVEAVINYDIPQDIEYYVHRIGRTGRAGKKGRAFTLVVGKQIYKVREIERACNTTMKLRPIPSVDDVTSAKAENVFDEVMKVKEENDLTAMVNLIEQKIEDSDFTALEMAAAFLKLQMGKEPEEIRVEKFVPRSRSRRDGSSGKRFGGRSDGYRGFDKKRDDRGRSGEGRRRDASRGDGERSREEYRGRTDEGRRKDYFRGDADKSREESGRGESRRKDFFRGDGDKARDSRSKGDKKDIHKDKADVNRALDQYKSLMAGAKRKKVKKKEK
ncbi:MAG: DEAD/DEAH box helicase [Lachnospiraceae bacterium]|nr:DEAD/DEAH box helicase [Lachnospiraceae bacterium]